MQNVPSYRQSAMAEAMPTMLGELPSRDDIGTASRRGDQGDDEEELMWAALEKLPTYDRVRTAFLETVLNGGHAPEQVGDDALALAEDGAKEKAGATAKLMMGKLESVNLSYLSKSERVRILDKAFATTEQDNERLLVRLKERIAAVNIELPKVEVRFENLSVGANVYVGSQALPTLVNFVRNLVEEWLAVLGILASKKRDLKILKAMSGVIKPGRMTLLLGPPGSGKSTLLRALAGKLDTNLRKSGSVTYNGHALNEFDPQRTASYIGQDDNHIGELTVRETLDFAARCQGVGYKQEMLLELVRREREQHIRPDPYIDAFMKATAIKGSKHSLSTDYVMKVLGLEVCADTVVGSNMLRGVSGGQKKRVTMGEMVVGPKKTLFMDEISTGLDSSTTFQIVKCVRNFVHLLDGTVLMALLQPPPETYELFDDVLLLSEGHIVYLGSREGVLEFFESMGFKLPPRKSVADFLQEVTSRKDQQQYWAGGEPYRYIPVAEFAEAFRERSEVGKELEQLLATPFDKNTSHPGALQKAGRYDISKLQLFKACMERELLLISRNRFLYIFRTAQVVFMAIITATLFFRTRMHTDSEVYGNLYMGSLFYALAHMMFHGLSELSMTVMQLPVFYKQRDNHFYPGWAFSLPSWILKIPYSVVEGVIWSCIVYYTIGLTPEPQRFFRYMFLLMLMHQMALGLFRLIGSVGRNPIIANTLGSFGLMVPFLLGGFVINRTNIHSWWIWGYWVSPLSYAQNALAVNEFLSPQWDKPATQGGNGSMYLNILKPRGLFAESYWYWIGVGVLVGYIILFNALVTLALSYLKPLQKPQTVVPESLLQDGDGDNRGATTAIEMDVLKKSKGMILPFQPLSLTFHKVSYYVDMPPAMKGPGVTEDRLQLLREVSGAFRPGVLTALVGVSGAGKTTLMDVLAGRKTGGYIEGDIRISGFPKVQKTFARVAGYVEQTDIHSPQLTVYDSLVYSSWLRLPREVDAATRNEFVEEVMELVELTSLRNALVGLQGTSGLSTEQRKRLTVAVELVANPSIIFMDEPTSGLDARAAAIVMRTVRNTVDTGRTVVCTIHQPSIDIFEAFDELLLMKRGGRAIYSGPLGWHSCTLVEYFQAIQGVPKIPEGYNPATWMLEISNPAAEHRLGKDFADLFQSSSQYQRTEALIAELSIPTAGSKDLEFATEYSQDPWSQFRACLWKQNLMYWQNPYYNVVRFFFTTACALIFGSIFWGVGVRSSSMTQQGVFNLMGAMFSAVVFLGVNNSSSVQPVVAVERTVFYRERAAGMYSPLPYALAQGAIEIPYSLAQTVVYGVITYSMMQFEWTAAKFLWYLAFMFLTFVYFTMYGMMAVGLTSSLQMAAVISSAFYSMWNLFTGFFIPRPRMPGWWVWFYWIDPMSWTVYGLVTSQLGDVKDVIQAPGFGEVSVEKFLREYFGYKHELLGVCAAVLVGFIAVFWLGFAASIKFINYQKR